jgi:prefoldin alpha subunit
MATGGAPRSINLDTLPLDQLQRFRKQIEDDIKMLRSNVATLSSAQDRYAISLETLNRLNDGESELMIPLSSSMYVRGKTNTKGKVTVDLGTGFMARVPNQEGQAIIKRKIDYIAKNRQAFQDDLQKQSSALDQITAVLQQRIQEQTAMMEKSG